MDKSLANRGSHSDPQSSTSKDHPWECTGEYSSRTSSVTVKEERWVFHHNTPTTSVPVSESRTHLPVTTSPTIRLVFENTTYAPVTIVTVPISKDLPDSGFKRCPPASESKTPTATGTRNPAPEDLPYIGDIICIRQIGSTGCSAFVSKYSNRNGNDNWYRLVDNWGSDAQWRRRYWEVAVIKNADDSDRRGFYVNAENTTVYITVRSLDDIEVFHAKRS